MQTDILKSDLREDIKELRTPTDKRTKERKALIKLTKECVKCTYYSRWGYWANLTTRDINLFTQLQTN